MAPLKDDQRLRAYLDALNNWGFKEYICFELTETAHNWLRTEFDGVGLKELGRLMFEHVAAGGEIDEVVETRPEWSDYEFHYDLRFSIQVKPIYVETRLHFEPPFQSDQSSILVVNIHAP